MTTKILLLCLSFCLPVFCFAQHKSSDERKLQEVLDTLLDGLAFQSTTPPIITFRGSEQRTATYDSNIIKVERKAYNVLKNSDLLDEGLALVIGHELGHLDLDKSSKHSPFSVVPLDIDDYKSQQCNGKCKKMEDYCDRFGCFAAYRAGYDIWSKTDAIIQVLCEAYRCQQSTSHHTQPNRIKVLNSLKKPVEDMSHIFDIAYRMTLIGEYQKSQTCYKIIDKTFPSREIKNNKALNQLLEGLAFMQKEMNLFSYPFELDNETRLREEVRGKDEEDAKKSDELIYTAIQTLSTIVGEHPEYTPATFNLACAYLLAGDLANAKMHFSSCIVVNDIITQHKAKMGEAIIELISSQDTSGLKWLEKNAATEHLRYMAKLNLNLNKPIAPKKSSDKRNTQFDTYTSHKSDNSRQLLNSNIQYIKNGTTPIYFIDNMTLQINDSQLPVKGYSKSRIDTLLQGSPYSSIPTKSGTYYIYKNKAFSGNYSKTIGLVIHTNNNNEVVEYFMYYVE